MAAAFDSGAFQNNAFEVTAGAVDVSSATTDGADVLAVSVNPVSSGVDVSSATTDGADALAASVSPVVGVSSAQTDGADTLAAAVSPVVSVSSVRTDGADTLSANVSPVIGVSSVKTDGEDILAASVNPVAASTDVSSATTDGADSVQAQVDSGAAAVASFSAEVELLPKRKWYIKRDNKLNIFATAEDADAFIEANRKADEAIAQAQKTSRLARKRLREKIVRVAAPEKTLEFDYLAELVSRYAIPVNLPNLIAQQDWERVMQIMAMALQAQDEDDIEMLLLA